MTPAKTQLGEAKARNSHKISKSSTGTGNNTTS